MTEGAKGMEEQVRLLVDRDVWPTTEGPFVRVNDKPRDLERLVKSMVTLCVEYAQEQVEARETWLITKIRALRNYQPPTDDRPVWQEIQGWIHVLCYHRDQWDGYLKELGDLRAHLAAAEEAAHSTLDLLEQERRKTAALEARVKELACDAHKSINKRPGGCCAIGHTVSFWDEKFCAAVDEGDKQIAALEAQLSAMSQDLLRLQGEGLVLREALARMGHPTGCACAVHMALALAPRRP